MKTSMILKAIGLTYFMGGLAIMASAAPEAGKALSFTERTACMSPVELTPLRTP